MFAERRAELMSRMKDAVAVFFAAPETIRNNDVHNEYRQDSDFFFLTGFVEPESVLVLAPHKDEGERVTLFLMPRDPEREVWDGERMGAERAPDQLGVDQAFSIEELGEKLPGLFTGARRVYHSLGKVAEQDQTILSGLAGARRLRKKGFDTPGDVLDPAPLLHERRLIKNAAEIQAMRTAAQLAARGHRRAMAVTRPELNEFHVQAAMEYVWRVNGAKRTAYPSIVGSGPNACVLHYRANDRPMGEGEMVLVDAGCEVDYHASDITRTWPVSGKFSDAQREIYALVLKSQKAAIDQCRAGRSFDSVHQVAVRVLTEGMIELGLIEGEVDQCIKDETFKKYYMHRTGHWIGMDVHDVGAYYSSGTSRALEPGMVLTVEPGIYISPHDEECPPRFRGIGIRIEDDVLVTTGAPDVLSADAPKEIDEIEALVGTADLLG